ncbi:hypothetical protein FQN54_003040 [Arachnomyces sp. PD_36]|nr:hypothetical protein FQN54_003040 [Arachnomyces sp. PD_36]
MTLEEWINPSQDGWFHVKNEAYWAAAGFKIEAFQMLALDVVLGVGFGSLVKLAIFAIGTADVPNKDPKGKFAYVEIGLATVVDLSNGTLKVDGQLSPSSFILQPDCHLSGGFGLYYWFDAPDANQDPTQGNGPANADDNMGRSSNERYIFLGKVWPSQPE